MGTLKIDSKVIDILIEKLFSCGHLCIIGGSKCGKSKLSERILSTIINESFCESSVDKISGVAFARQYTSNSLDKPILYLKNVSGLSIFNLEMLFNNYYLITTFPVLSPDLLFNRFISFNPDCREIKNFDKRIWDCLPIIIENKKLDDGNDYLMRVYKIDYSNGIILTDNICGFNKDNLLYEEEFSRVEGKYIFE